MTLQVNLLADENSTRSPHSRSDDPTPDKTACLLSLEGKILYLKICSVPDFSE